MKMFDPPKNKETLPAYLFKYMPQFLISSLAGIIYNTVIVSGPIFLGRLIDAANTGIRETLILSALYFVVITAFFQFARFIKRWFMRDQFNRVACDLRQTLLERTLQKSLPELEKETVGDMMSRTVSDITLVVDTVMSTLNEGWDTWLLMVSYFVALMVMDWKITLISSVMIPITLLIAHHMRNILYQYSMKARKAVASANTGLKRYLDGVSVLRLFGREAEESQKIQTSFTQQAKFNIKEMLLQQALLPVYSLVAGLGIVVALGLLGEKVVKGQMSVGEFNSFLIMFVAFSGRTKVAAKVFNRWHGAKAAWKRVKEKMIYNPKTDRSSASTADTCNELNVNNLNFYLGDKKVLSDISFKVSKGQIIGITGAIGSGKTALAYALSGMYPYEGNINIDENELHSIDAKSKTKLIAYTGHEQFLFSQSIQDNITLGSACNESKVSEVVKLSALTEDIQRFKDGLDTVVGEKGVMASGGQRQRISLARVLYTDATILLLDDPFSAVDIATEQEIIKGLRDLAKDKIILIFTHRLTIFPLVDDIIVLDKGRIVEHGSHNELMKNDSLYSHIFKAQEFMEVGNYE